LQFETIKIAWSKWFNTSVVALLSENE